MKKTFVVVENRAAGKIWIDSYLDHELWSSENPNGLTYTDIVGRYGNIVFEGTEEECQEYMDNAIEQSRIWVLFCDDIRCDAFVEEWKLGMGAYQQRSPYTVMGEFKSKDEALEALNKELEWYEEAKAQA